MWSWVIQIQLQMDVSFPKLIYLGLEGITGKQDWKVSESVSSKIVIRVDIDSC